MRVYRNIFLRSARGVLLGASKRSVSMMRQCECLVTRMTLGIGVCLAIQRRTLK